MAGPDHRTRIDIPTSAGPVVLLVPDELDERWLRARITAWLGGTHDDFADVPLPAGTAFQRACWAACRSIPRGEVRTYAWLADAAGCPGAARAAGQAMRRNPLPIVVPCHRVVGARGWIGGYAGDSRAGSATVGVKRLLLELERRDADVSSSPRPAVRPPRKLETPES